MSNTEVIVKNTDAVKRKQAVLQWLRLMFDTNKHCGIYENICTNEDGMIQLRWARLCVAHNIPNPEFCFPTIKCINGKWDVNAMLKQNSSLVEKWVQKCIKHSVVVLPLGWNFGNYGHVTVVRLEIKNSKQIFFDGNGGNHHPPEGPHTDRYNWMSTTPLIARYECQPPNIRHEHWFSLQDVL
uniref:Uncharacterized protein n=1 Tax=Eutreptiella gymnastica TaxID=73025 RepID=A0A7S1I599_9EUGL